MSQRISIDGTLLVLEFWDMVEHSLMPGTKSEVALDLVDYAERVLEIPVDDLRETDLWHAAGLDLDEDDDWEEEEAI